MRPSVWSVAWVAIAVVAVATTALGAGQVVPTCVYTCPDCPGGFPLAGECPAATYPEDEVVVDVDGKEDVTIRHKF